jgi:lipoprotein-releasing system permease protein
MRLTRINKLPLVIGLRYSFSRSNNRFIGVVSMVSLLGMALGVASLIVVLAVMNGFADELRGRILSVIPHASVQATNGPLLEWQQLQQLLESNNSVKGSAPYISAKVLMGSHRYVQGAQLLAIDAEREPSVSKISENMSAGQLQALSTQRWGVILGSLLARSLGVGIGDKVELTAPVLTHTPLGSLPRRKRFEVLGTFQVGAQLDSSHALVSLADGQALLGRGQAVDGIRLAYDDLFQAPQLSRALAEQVPAGVKVVDWRQSHSSLFSAVSMEKTMITVLLLSVVAVAAFNIVSTLTMAVTEKRSDIAVLRTMGAGRLGVMAVFMCQGMLLSLCGIGLGALVGCLVALNISELTLLLEGLLGIKIFDPQVYFISNLPARLDGLDVGMTVALAMVLSLLATLVPAWRAAQVDPAEILRYG